jgi:hypothetical protein
MERPRDGWVRSFDRRQQQSVKRTTCLKRFRALYGSNPIVYAQIIEDLQTTHYHITGHLDMIGWCCGARKTIETFILC